MIGGIILRRAKKALEMGIINKREYNTVLKSSSGRITNRNTASQNILLERIKQTEPGQLEATEKRLYPPLPKQREKPKCND